MVNIIHKMKDNVKVEPDVFDGNELLSSENNEHVISKNSCYVITFDIVFYKNIIWLKATLWRRYS